MDAQIPLLVTILLFFFFCSLEHPSIPISLLVFWKWAAAEIWDHIPIQTLCYIISFWRSKPHRLLSSIEYIPLRKSIENHSNDLVFHISLIFFFIFFFCFVLLCTISFRHNSFRTFSNRSSNKNNTHTHNKYRQTSNMYSHCP